MKKGRDGECHETFLENILTVAAVRAIVWFAQVTVEFVHLMASIVMHTGIVTER